MYFYISTFYWMFTLCWRHYWRQRSYMLCVIDPFLVFSVWYFFDVCFERCVVVWPHLSKSLVYMCMNVYRCWRHPLLTTAKLRASSLDRMRSLLVFVFLFLFLILIFSAVFFLFLFEFEFEFENWALYSIHLFFLAGFEVVVISISTGRLTTISTWFAGDFSGRVYAFLPVLFAVLTWCFPWSS